MDRSARLGWLSFWALTGLGLTGFAGQAKAAMDGYPIARLRMLDKVTARTSTFDVRVDTTVRFGQLYIRPRACRKASPLEAPESASFLQIWEVTPKQEAQWIFSGWMFSSSPALSSMDNPIYDVWVLDCVGDMPVQPEAGQIGFSSGQVGFASGQIGYASGGHAQVTFLSGGQIGYSSAVKSQIGATSGVIFSSSGVTGGVAGSMTGQINYNSTVHGESGGHIPYGSGGPEPAPANNADTQDPDAPLVPDNRDNDSGVPPEPASPPAPSDEVAPSSIQNPVY